MRLQEAPRVGVQVLDLQMSAGSSSVECLRRKGATVYRQQAPQLRNAATTASVAPWHWLRAGTALAWGQGSPEPGRATPSRERHRRPRRSPGSLRLIDISMQPGRLRSDCARLNPRSIKKAVERRPGHPRRPDGRLATMPTSQIGVGDM
eukprot:COSAG01_NODE_1339_length_10661_cov_49.319068_8_plen_149_part_00